ncbi:MAG: MATE family efflux transporter [Clostridia bacterium]|nr:MATE family efflux transporter [Clostridia bacterium]
MRSAKLSLAGLFRDREFWSAIRKLALPLAMQNLLTSSLALIDTVMVGSLGSLSISAVGFASQVAFFANIVMFGIASGGAVFIAQYWGNNDRDGIAKTFGMTLVCNIPISLTFFLLAFFTPELMIGIFTDDALAIAEGARYIKIASFSYLGVALNQTMSIALRSTEHVKSPIAVSAVSVVLNALLNYILIFGKLGFEPMGVEGAAYATAISALAAPVLLIIISLIEKNILVAPLRKLFGFDSAFVKEFFRRATPVLINESLWALGVVGCNMILGRLGTDNYSALTISRTVENLAFVFFLGICNACNVLVAKNVGAGNIAKAKRHATQFMALVPMLAIALGLVIILLRGPILSVFNITDAERAIAFWLLLIYGCEVGLRNLPYIAVVGVFRAAGDTKIGMKYDLVFLWFIALPVTFLCAFVLKLPFVAVYAVMLLCEDIPKTLVCLRRFAGLKWIMPVTEEGIRGLREYKEELYAAGTVEGSGAGDK